MLRARSVSLVLSSSLWFACGGEDATVAGSTSTAGTTTNAAGTTTGSAGEAAPTSGEAASSGEGGSSGGAASTGAGEASTGAVDETTSGSSAGATTEGGSTETGDPVVPGPKVKVMSFNIRVGTANDGANAWDNRKGIVFAFLNDQGADVIGMQEDLRFQLLAIDDNVAGYKRVGVGTVDGDTQGPFNAIYFKKERFALDEWDRFSLSDTPGQAGSTSWGNEHPRAVTWARLIEKDTGYAFYVFNTHFDHMSQNSREKSAVLLAKRVDNREEPDPFVVTGDFNAGESNVAIRFLKGNAKIGGEDTAVKMADTFRIFKPDAEAVGTAHGFNGGTGGNKIDYVWALPGTEVVNAFISHHNVDGKYPSDHFPVIGVVRFADR